MKTYCGFENCTLDTCHKKESCTEDCKAESTLVIYDEEFVTIKIPNWLFEQRTMKKIQEEGAIVFLQLWKSYTLRNKEKNEKTN